MIEMQSIVLSIFASVLGDQVLIMLMTGLIHLCGRSCVANLLPETQGMTAPDDVMTAPQEVEHGLLPE